MYALSFSSGGAEYQPSRRMSHSTSADTHASQSSRLSSEGGGGRSPSKPEPRSRVISASLVSSAFSMPEQDRRERRASRTRSAHACVGADHGSRAAHQPRSQGRITAPAHHVEPRARDGWTVREADGRRSESTRRGSPRRSRTPGA